MLQRPLVFFKEHPGECLVLVQAGTIFRILLPLERLPIVVRLITCIRDRLSCKCTWFTYGIAPILSKHHQPPSWFALCAILKGNRLPWTYACPIVCSRRSMPLVHLSWQHRVLLGDRLCACQIVQSHRHSSISPELRKYTRTPDLGLTRGRVLAAKKDTPPCLVFLDCPPR